MTERSILLHIKQNRFYSMHGELAHVSPLEINVDNCLKDYQNGPSHRLIF